VTATAIFLAATSVLVATQVLAAVHVYRRLGAFSVPFAPRIAKLLRDGPLVGHVPPALELELADGSVRRVEGPADRPRLLVFVPLGAPGLDRFEAELEAFLREGEDYEPLVLARTVAGARNGDRPTRFGGAPLARAEQAFDRWSVANFPYAVVLDRRGRVYSKGLVNDREQLASLEPLGRQLTGEGL